MTERPEYQALKLDVTSEARQALQVPCSSRTHEQLRVLSRWTRNIPVLARLPEKARTELASVIQYQALHGGYILAKKGDGSPSVFIIFSGTAILRSKEANIQRPLHVSACCGELGLLDSTLDTPTVFVPENGSRDVLAEVARIPKEVFLRLVAPYQLPVLRARMSMVQKLNFFHNSDSELSPAWTTQRIAELSSVLVSRSMKRGETILKQGKVCNRMFFVCSGRCIMSRSTYVTKHNSWPTEHFEDGWKLSDRALGFPITSTEVGNRVSVKFSPLKPGDFFGDSVFVRGLAQHEQRRQKFGCTKPSSNGADEDLVQNHDIGPARGEWCSVICEQDGELLELPEELVPYLLQRNNTALAQLLDERKASRPSEADLVKKVRCLAREKGVKKEVRKSEQKSRDEVNFWPGTKIF